MNCKDCKYWVKGNFPKSEIGECRRFPPTMKCMNDTDRFPITWDTYWCGEYKKSKSFPNKIPKKDKKTK